MSAKRSTPLTRAEIFETALRLIDADGADALSMRRLARELGVEAMSLYHHVPNKDALLEGVVDLALAAEAPAPAPGSAAWVDVVTAAVVGFRRALVAHPRVLPLMVSRPPSSPEASRMYIEAPLGFLIANGFSHRDASELFEGVFALSFGHALLSANYPEIATEVGPTVSFTEESFERTVRTLCEGYGQSRENAAVDEE